MSDPRPPAAPPAAPSAEVTLDCQGLLCPLPVLRARKRLATLPPGTVLAVQATDPMAAIDLPHFCAEAGHRFLGAEAGPTFTTYRLRRD